MSKRNGNGAHALKLDLHNARKHPDRNKAQIAASLKELGAGRSILVDATDTIIAGNGVYEQAQALGYRVKVIEADGKTLIAVKRPDLKGAKARRMALADNRATETSEWDIDILADLAANDADALAGLFDERELRDLLGDKMPGGKEETADAGEVLVDKAEELQAKWGVVSGDIWQIADHFIICGDCRDFGTWQKLLGAAKVERVNGVFTSPPYAEQRKKQYGGVATDKYIEWWTEVQANVRANLAPDGSFFVNIKPHCEDGERVLYVFDLVLAMRRQWGWKYVDELCWKRTAVPGNYSPRFKNAFEPIYHFAVDVPKHHPETVAQPLAESSVKRYRFAERKGEDKMGRRHNSTGSGFNGDYAEFLKHDTAFPSNVIEIAAEVNENNHAAAFPVALPEFFVKAYSDTGDVWLDPFLGSGTTIVAAYRNGRRGLGIEKLEKYVSVTLERLTALGLEAKRVTDTNGNGKTKATA